MGPWVIILTVIPGAWPIREFVPSSCLRSLILKGVSVLCAAKALMITPPSLQCSNSDPNSAGTSINGRRASGSVYVRTFAPSSEPACANADAISLLCSSVTINNDSPSFSAKTTFSAFLAPSNMTSSSTPPSIMDCSPIRFIFQ